MLGWQRIGGVSEWSNEPVSKTGRGESLSGVRISPPPQNKSSQFCGVYWTKFECISDKIRRILTNDTCASAALDKLARDKTKKFPIIFICGSPTPAAAKRKI